MQASKLNCCPVRGQSWNPVSIESLQTGLNRLNQIGGTCSQAAHSCSAADSSNGAAACVLGAGIHICNNVSYSYTYCMRKRKLMVKYRTPWLSTWIAHLLLHMLFLSLSNALTLETAMSVDKFLIKKLLHRMTTTLSFHSVRYDLGAAMKVLRFRLSLVVCMMVWFPFGHGCGGAICLWKGDLKLLLLYTMYSIDSNESFITYYLLMWSLNTTNPMSPLRQEMLLLNGMMRWRTKGRRERSSSGWFQERGVEMIAGSVLM